MSAVRKARPDHTEPYWARGINGTMAGFHPKKYMARTGPEGYLYTIQHPLPLSGGPEEMKASLDVHVSLSRSSRLSKNIICKSWGK